MMIAVPHVIEFMHCFLHQPTIYYHKTIVGNVFAKAMPRTLLIGGLELDAT